MKNVLIAVDDSGQMMLNAKGCVDQLDVLALLVAAQQAILEDIARSKAAEKPRVEKAPAAALLHLPNGRAG